MMDYRSPTELWHYGVKGQKWGVRRYQNTDGSYTEEGKKHRSESAVGKAVATAGLIGASSIVGADTVVDAVRTHRKLVAAGKRFVSKIEEVRYGLLRL